MHSYNPPHKKGDHVPTTAEQVSNPLPLSPFQKQDFNRANQKRKGGKEGKGERKTGDPFGEVVPSPITAAGLIPVVWDSQLSCYGNAALKITSVASKL